MSEQTPWQDDQQQAQYGELDGYADDYKPEHAFRAGIDTLPNGSHDCTIIAAAMERVTGGDLIVRISLQTTTAGQVEWTHWLNRQGGVNGLCADLKALGFDSDKWGRQRPLSVEIPKAVAQLQGIRFRGRKTSREGKPKHPGATPETFHDFRALSRISGQGQPASNRMSNSPAPMPAQGAGVSDDIPF